MLLEQPTKKRQTKDLVKQLAINEGYRIEEV